MSCLGQEGMKNLTSIKGRKWLNIFIYFLFNYLFFGQGGKEKYVLLEPLCILILKCSARKMLLLISLQSWCHKDSCLEKQYQPLRYHNHGTKLIQVTKQCTPKLPNNVLVKKE